RGSFFRRLFLLWRWLLYGGFIFTRLVGRTGEDDHRRLGLHRRTENEFSVGRLEGGEQEIGCAVGTGFHAHVLLVIVLRWRLATVVATHFLAQVRRLRIDRRERIDGAERGRQPRQAAAIESHLEQLGGLLRARRPGIGAENDRDQPPPAAGGAGNHI